MERAAVGFVPAGWARAARMCAEEGCGRPCCAARCARAAAARPVRMAAGGAAAENGNGATPPEPAQKTGFRQKLAEQLPTAREAKKLVPLGLMFFMILFNYTILRDTKDVLVVTAAGAEIIPYLKTYCNLPGAILFTVVYSALSNRVSRENLFYMCLFPFVAFFLAFGFIMYPNTAALHPVAAVAHFKTLLPAGLQSGLQPFLAIIENWTFALFYTLAELWGSVIVSLLFWGFANEITSVKEAEKYYPLFGLGANVALIFSGQYVRFVSDVRRNLAPGVDGWALSLKYLMSAIGVGGAIIMGLYKYMQEKVVKNPELVNAKTANKAKKKKPKASLSMVESAKYLASSSYIRSLAAMVIGYGMSINIVEVTWKSRLRAAFPDPNDYSSFMGNFSTATGSATFVLMLAGRFIFQKFGWATAALITPVVLGITGVMFFALTLFGPQLAPLVQRLGTTPLMLAVMVGAVQNVMSKGSKYAFFDPCKEMAYIPLDDEQKSKGKAAVDVIGNPLGKSGGSFIQQVLIFSLGSLAASTPYLAGILMTLVVMWIGAANTLAKQFKEKQGEMRAEELEEEAILKAEAQSAGGSPAAPRPAT
ncbi:ADP,ATP carrier protein 1, chloroplastic [Porphyridium purpureum]|uniref:ADP,ATP carrier protein n=1 Tax=Porphyridium purpureum TaxID=35688 RepID=A0A5J4YSR5_PORPP|nr:ADP,ATP carrier protein 1, chloroplastic [Porphyridium purpureum]|eukprot:POR2397..scf229_5